MNSEWRVLASGLSAWFEAPSQTAGAALVGRIAELTDALPAVDLRDRGVRVRLPDPELATVLTAAAKESGLTADPSVLQELHLRVETLDRTSVATFWHAVLGYDRLGDDALVDPVRRDPTFSFRPLAEQRPLRNRIHVDVVRPWTLADARETARAAGGREALAGDYYSTVADAEGNEVDIVGGEEIPGAADWQAVFAGMTCYPTDSPAQAADLAMAVAGLADAAGVPLLVDLRPDGVTIDTGKDLWEDERFADLAVGVQSAAHDLGLTADPARSRFVQFGIDAVDLPAVRSFWQTLLGYDADTRPYVTDIYDPRRLNPVLFFQQMDAADEDRRRQRNRLRPELFVAPDHVRSRVDAALGAGGRIVDEDGPDRLTLADPENNELDLVAAGR